MPHISTSTMWLVSVSTVHTSPRTVLPGLRLLSWKSRLNSRASPPAANALYTPTTLSSTAATITLPVFIALSPFLRVYRAQLRLAIHVPLYSSQRPRVKKMFRRFLRPMRACAGGMHRPLSASTFHLRHRAGIDSLRRVCAEYYRNAREEQACSYVAPSARVLFRDPQCNAPSAAHNSRWSWPSHAPAGWPGAGASMRRRWRFSGS